MNTKKKLVKKGFTLVELIIVIAIIAILAVTAFLLLTKWLSKARDSSRASNLANIEKSLQISLTDKSSLPKPDSYTLIYASGTSNVIGYQGYFGDGVKDAVGNINSAPKDGDDYFTYYLNADLNKYQLAGFLENTTAYNPNSVNAVDYSARFVTVKGDRLGLLTDANKSPLQTLGLTGLDILNTTNTYTAHFTNNENINGTGKSLISMLTLNNKNLAKYDTGLVGYWDMETLNGNKLKDLSNYGNDGTISGNIQIGGENGIKGKSTYFNGSGCFEMGTYDPFNGDATISIRINKKKFYQDKYETLISKRDGRASDFSNHKWDFIILKNSNYLLFQKYGTNATTLNSNSKILTDKWIHIVYVNKIGLNSYYYIDGVLDKTLNAFAYGNKLTAVVRLGCVGDYSGETLKDAYLDEVRIYNRALSDDEVKTLYKAN